MSATTDSPPQASQQAPSAKTGKRRSLLALLLVPALVFAAVVFLVPLGNLVYGSLAGGAGAESFIEDATNRTFLHVLLRTAWISLTVTVVCLVLGYPVAYLAARHGGIVGIVLLGIVCLPFFTSALVRTYAWTIILADRGPINEFLLWLGVVDEPVRLVYNDIGVVIGMSQVLLPMMIFPLYNTMRGIDRSLLSASRSLGCNGTQSWWRVYLPLSRPGVVAGCTLVFISAIGYYITPMLLQGPSSPMFAQRIDSLLGQRGMRETVATEAVVMLAITLVLMLLFRKPLGLTLSASSEVRQQLKARSGRRFFTGMDSYLSNGVIVRAGEAIARVVEPVRLWIAWALTAVAILLAISPFAVISVLAFSDDSYLTFPPSGYSTRWIEAYFTDSRWLAATELSIRVSIFAAIVGTAIGALAAFAIARGGAGRYSPYAYVFLIAPLIVPQTVVAVALLFGFIPVGLNGTETAIFLAYILLCLPYAVIVMNTAFQGLNRAYEDAAASLGSSPVKVTYTVVLPLVAPALVASVMFGFVMGFSDLVFAQFVGGARAETLERLMFRTIREIVSPQVASVGFLFFTAIVVLGLIALFVFRRPRTTAGSAQ
ncbi:ABC transporter permease subunit [Sediminivirga luteola]|uniref:Spermidine/putrescine ABC transporter ATP-binding protein n=1 Tax=Sediminivirga luteola TaxID=1774748 RepID=A0A8J2U1D4_9MICO|nr:ABC transporter permease subunit [Sediminivirga luteola]GGA29017.1 spermidine/putrescine ABC transporter ATP-binding protein [Sediminivirga luteola]